MPTGFHALQWGTKVVARVVVMIVVPMSAQLVAAAQDPSAVYCEELGYTADTGKCVFPDGGHCNFGAFYSGECGAPWSYCEQHGGRVQPRVETMDWYAVCVFPDGSECGEQDYMKGKCKPSDCARWSTSRCDPVEPEEPSETEEPLERDESSEAEEEPERMGSMPKGRRVPFTCSHFTRDNPPLTRQVLPPGSLLTIDLCSADWMGCDWDDQAELGDPFVLHQSKHKSLDKKKALLRFSPVERFQFLMDEPGNSAITFTCRGDDGEAVETLVAAVTVDPAAVSVSLGEDGIQVMAATGEVKNFVPSSMTMPYFIKCKTLERGRQPIDRIRANLFDQFGFVVCAADWLDCDWIGQTEVSDTGIVLQYDHQHIEKPALRKNPEKRYWFQTIGEGSSEITFTCMGEDGDEVRTHHVTLTVGEERWAEIVPYKRREEAGEGEDPDSRETDDDVSREEAPEQDSRE